MNGLESLPLLGLAGLGALHGINPGMGWLFAVALGLQEQRRRAVWAAMLPLALGHALAIGAAVTVALAVGLVMPSNLLRWTVAGVLILLGVYRVFRHAHVRYGGMRVNARQLTAWSFLMASAHGAGLMVLPLVLGQGVPAPGAHAHHATQAAVLPVGFDMWGLAATAAHTAGYLLVTVLVAVVVYEKLGLRLLRSLWINLDLIWAVALVGTGVVTGVVG